MGGIMRHQTLLLGEHSPSFKRSVFLQQTNRHLVFWFGFYEHQFREVFCTVQNR